jgi:hypothetical protein
LLIWGKREVEYFCKGGWTGFTDLPVTWQVRVDHKCHFDRRLVTSGLPQKQTS